MPPHRRRLSSRILHPSLVLAAAAPALALALAPPALRAGTLYDAPPAPFSQLALGIDIGTPGLGVELATPILPDLSLRGGADFLPASASFTSNNITYDGDINLRTGQLSLDWTPFHGSFRISPGVMVYNRSSVSASTSVAPGQYFIVNQTTWYSSPTDPVHGTAGATWPNAGPRLTVGWGNMLPRRASRHFAVTSEFGVAYFGTGTVSYSFAGTVCTPSTTPPTCYSAAASSSSAFPTLPPRAPSSSAFQDDVAAARASFQRNMRYARFYPILRTGLSFRF